jgi:hypothetical protein
MKQEQIKPVTVAPNLKKVKERKVDDTSLF